MDDPLGPLRPAFDAMFKATEQARHLLEPSNSIRDALDAAKGGTAMRHLQDITTNDAFRSQLAATQPVLEMMRTLKLNDDMKRRILGLHDLPLKSVLGQLSVKPSWMDTALAATTPGWMSAANQSAGLDRRQRMFDDIARQTRAATHVYEQHTASLGTLEAVLKPALEAQRPIHAMFERMGFDSMQRLKDLFEPASLRIARDTLTRIQTEHAAFAAALPDLKSPWARIDWRRMRHLIDETHDLAEDLGKHDEQPDVWGVDEIPPEEQAEFTEAMRPVVEAIQTAAVSSEQRDAKQAEAVAAIFSYCERLEARVDSQGKLLNGIDAKLAREKRSRNMRWAVALLMFLCNTAWDLSKEWAATHTTPMVDRALGLLDEPVSIGRQPSAIRRDATEAIREIEVPTADVPLLRVVIHKSLPVFADAHSHGPCTNQLRSGQIVAIAEWRQKWRRVEWRDSESGELLSGWVRAKYIAKIVR